MSLRDDVRSGPDAQRVARLLARDHNEWIKLFGEMTPRMEAAAWGILKNKECADDAVQETWVRVFKNIAQFRGKSALATWIYSILVNVSHDALRRKRTLISIEELPEDTLCTVDQPLVLDDGENFRIDALLTMDRVAVAEQWLAALTPQDKLMLSLREDGVAWRAIVKEMFPSEEFSPEALTKRSNQLRTRRFRLTALFRDLISEVRRKRSHQ